VGLVEKETKIGENDPQFLPARPTLELAQQVATQQVLKHNIRHILASRKH